MDDLSQKGMISAYAYDNLTEFYEKYQICI